MGIYNCAPTLAVSLDSLLAQTYQNFKVVMCDDGSTDNTAEIARHYVDNYPGKFILIQNEHNKGLNHTLNRCLKLADTEYVARMDGDDISLPERFAKEIGFLDSHPELQIVSTPMIYFDSCGEFRRDTGGYLVEREDFLYGTPFCHAPCMVKKYAYEKVNGYSEEKHLLRVEDYHLWFKMYAAGFKGYVLKEPYYKMRDDRNAFKRRTWRNRLNEYNVRKAGYKMLGFPWYKTLYRFRPILVGLIPGFIYRFYHQR